MPANGRWDLIRRLKVKSSCNGVRSRQNCTSSVMLWALSTAVKLNAAVPIAVGEVCSPPRPHTRLQSQMTDFRIIRYRMRGEFVRTVSPLGMAIECHPNEHS